MTETRPATDVPVRPLRVCHLSLTLNTGGLERILADIAWRSDPQRCDTEFAAMRDVGRFADEIRAAGRTVHQLSPAGRAGQICQLIRLFRQRRYDVVHTHNLYPHIWGSIAARLAGIPVVVQTRHGRRFGDTPKSRVAYRWAAILVDQIVSVSDDAAQVCVENDRLPPAKIRRIWNGIDLSKFVYCGPAPAPIAIAVARLVPEKDFSSLIKAAALVVRDVPDFKLRVVGDGPERSHLEALAQRECPGCVEFLGERQDIPGLLAKAGFFVSSSLTEGISLTLLEAMAVGLPVIATSVGGNPEIVVENETGRLVPPDDPQAMARAIVRMCRTPDAWTTMGEAGRRRVHEHFDVQRMIAEYEALYHRLLSRKRS